MIIIKLLQHQILFKIGVKRNSQKNLLHNISIYYSDFILKVVYND